MIPALPNNFLFQFFFLYVSLRSMNMFFYNPIFIQQKMPDFNHFNSNQALSDLGKTQVKNSMQVFSI